VDFKKFFFSEFSGINSTYLKINSNYNDFGIHTSLDYRFYLQKENKYPAPRGVYIGPFMSYNFFKRETSWYLESPKFAGDLTTTLKLNILTVGGELGYQFILFKRLAIDFILLGPGIANYRLSANFNTSIDSEDQSLILGKLYSKLEENLIKFGWTANGDDFIKTGSMNTMGAGFRYMIHIGFNF